MKNRPFYSNLLLILFITTLLGIVFYFYKAMPLDKYDVLLTRIRQLQTLDAEFNQDILLSSNNFIHNYDSLVKTTQEQLRIAASVQYTLDSLAKEKIPT